MAPDSLAVFAALATELNKAPDEVITARAIVSGVRGLLPEADRVSLMVRPPRRAPATLASSDAVAAEVDALQLATGEGPCLLVSGAGEWLRSGEVDTDARWPTWGPGAARRGVQSLLSVALADREQPIGALTLYSARPGGFADRGVVDLVLAYAVHAATALAFARQVTTIQAAVSSRHVIGMAQGIVMARYDIDQQRSFELLRRLSSTSNVKLRDVAAHIVETRSVPHEAACGHVPD